jgi:Family of unknown function (DUF6010)
MAPQAQTELSLPLLVLPIGVAMVMIGLFSLIKEPHRGLRQYRAIAIGWVLHSAWDIAHHYYGNPIIPFAATSSIGCGVCDLVLAAWYAMGAPQLFRFMPFSKRTT